MEIKKFIHDKSLRKCLIMDAIGMASYLIPGLGEGFDILWAPVSAFIFFRTFGGTKGLLGGVINMIEEALPGLDIIPTFTIMYFLQDKITKDQDIVIKK
jgi:hypothetical protein